MWQKPCGQGLKAEAWSLAFRHERGVGRGSELKLGAWQWQQQLEQKFRHEMRWCFDVAKPSGQGLRVAEAWSLAVAAAAGAG